jgi:hypothetical protein
MSRIAVIERVSETAHQVPLGSKLGFAVMVLGIVADVVAHLEPALDHDHGSVAGSELSAHVIVFVGMALVLIGVLVDGVRMGRRSGGNAPLGR